MEKPFTDDGEVFDLVRRFESCEINSVDFRHYQHLTVALWYVLKFPFEVASERMCTGIQKLAAAHGKFGYHETITLFWLRVVSDFVATDGNGSICDLANKLVAAHDDKNLIKQFYSDELITSPAAKAGWVEPDLKPLRVDAQFGVRPR
jgi:hypothetical protein